MRYPSAETRQSRTARLKPKNFRTAVGPLYHLAEEENLTSILAHGLMSTERLLVTAGLSPSKRRMFLRQHRQISVRLSTGVSVRDQRPMPPTALAAALDDGLVPADWYELLNGFVFLWPNLDRVARHRRACGDRPQILLTFDGDALLEQFGSAAFVSPINSGNARRKPARRGRSTFRPYSTWAEDGWPSGLRTRPPAEFLFACTIPTDAPYLMNHVKI